MTGTGNIGISRKQRVFVALEDTEGTIQFPLANNFIRPAGDAVINQTPDFVDSEEKQDTLDVLDRFQNAKPPGEFTIPMYLRLDSTYGTPQGDALLQSWMGGLEVPTLELNAHLATTGTFATFGNLSGTLPHKGVVLIDSEEMYFSSYSTTAATQGVLHGLSKGYRSTTSVDHNAAASVTLMSRFYKQETTAPSISVWVETDHFIQGLRGATVGNVTVSITNTGAVMLNFTGQGMEMVWAGKTRKDLSNSAALGATGATVVNAKVFSVDSFIQNETISDNNSGSGYRVTATNATTNRIQITPAIAHTWSTGATISGYLPTETLVGTAIENRFTDVWLNDVAAAIKNTDVTFAVPKQYITDEVGVSAPQDFLEQVRDVTSNLDIYFRDDDYDYFKDGYDGNNATFLIRFGASQGQRLELYFPRTNLTVPTINFTAPAVNLAMPMKALGTNGEDSCIMITA